MQNIVEIVEAIIFASGDPIEKKDLIDNIPALTPRELNKVIEKLKLKYSGENGIILRTFNDKLQFSTNEKYGDVLADVLTPIREKKLSQSLLEVLSIIAYKQPITRLEIQEIKGKDPDYALSMLMKMELIEVKGRKDAVGRPILFGTTEDFLKKFQLENLEALPDYKEVLERITLLDKNYAEDRDTLYFKRKMAENEKSEEPDIIVVGGEQSADTDKKAEIPAQEAAFTEDEAVNETINPEEKEDIADIQEDDEDFEDIDEIPEFLKGEEIKEIS